MAAKPICDGTPQPTVESRPGGRRQGGGPGSQKSGNADALSWTVRAAAIFLPLNPAYTTGELAYFIGDASSALFVCDPASLESVQALTRSAAIGRGVNGSGSLPVLADPQYGEFSTLISGDDDIAAFLYTSGSTGRSKGATLSHANLISNRLTPRDCWRFEADDGLLHALPIFHTPGLFVATNVILAAGASMILLPSFDIDRVIEALPRCTMMMGVLHQASQG